MTEHAKRPYRRRLQATAMRVVNVPMRVALGLPFETPLSKRLMLATLRGRKSGKIYHQPLSYVEDGKTLLTPGGGNWKWNLREGEPVPLRLRGHDVSAKPELVRGADAIEPLLEKMVEVNPRVASFVGIPRGSDGRFDQQRLQTAVRYGFRIVRWHLEAEP